MTATTSDTTNTTNAGSPGLGGPEARENAVVTRRPWWRKREVLVDLAVLTTYLLEALFVSARVWRHLDRHILFQTATDQLRFEYFLQHAARIVTDGASPFFTQQFNAPDGANLMADTSTLGLHLPLVPVTLLFGQEVSFAVMVTFSMFGTAAVWYWLFSRHVVTSRFAAAVGGAFCGFAPGIVSQANGHPNIATQVLVPIILWRGLRLREQGRVLRNGIILGLLIAYQAFINEEILLFTALGSGLFVLVWALHDRAEARRLAGTFFKGVGVAALTAGVLLAYPLYIQFFGLQSYHGLWSEAENFGADLRSFVSFPGQSLAGSWHEAARLAQNPAEENAFFGWPLVVLSVVLATIFRQRIVVRAAVVAGGVLGLLSVGSRLRINGAMTNLPGPYAILEPLPLFDSVITTRLALFLIPVIALLIAVWIDATQTDVRGSREQVFRGRLVAIGLVVAALLPIAPTPLPTKQRTPTPEFFTSGVWRQYVPEDRTVVAVPVTSFKNAMEGMQWAADQRLDFRLAGGYFLRPGQRYPDRRAMFGAPPRPTSELLDTVGRTGVTPEITDTDRANAVQDLRYWQASIVVLAPRTNDDKLRRVTTELLGFEPRWVAGVWLWDVRGLVG